MQCSNAASTRIQETGKKQNKQETRQYIHYILSSKACASTAGNYRKFNMDSAF